MTDRTSLNPELLRARNMGGCLPPLGAKVITLAVDGIVGGKRQRVSKKPAANNCLAIHVAEREGYYDRRI